MIYSGRLRPIMIFSDPLTGAPSARLQLRPLHRTRDLSDLGGRGRIAGTVKVDSSPDYPVWRRVRLFDQRDNRLVAETWSDPVTGAYAFEYINPSRVYVVVSYDHTGVYNAEILDAVAPELMP
ncbi:MAG: hypothetical protein ACKOXG_06195 [Arenimonas sp.]